MPVMWAIICMVSQRCGGTAVPIRASRVEGACTLAKRRAGAVQSDSKSDSSPRGSWDAQTDNRAIAIGGWRPRRASVLPVACCVRYAGDCGRKGGIRFRSGSRFRIPSLSDIRTALPGLPWLRTAAGRVAPRFEGCRPSRGSLRPEHRARRCRSESAVPEDRGNRHLERDAPDGREALRGRHRSHQALDRPRSVLA